MKVVNYLGKNMPKLPWMINFESPQTKKETENFKQKESANANNHLAYLANLKINSKLGGSMLTCLSCTLGTKNTDPTLIANLIKQGMRSICIDMSIGSECEQLVLLNTIRGAAVRYGEEIGREFPFAIALEVTGLRMRIGRLESHDLPKITVQEKKIVFLTTDKNYECYCNTNMIYINYADLLKVLSVGNQIYIDYGTIILEVVEILKKYKTIKCTVINGGQLRDEAVIHLPNVPQHFESSIRTELITFAIQNQVDALILSKVQNAEIFEIVRDILGPENNAIMLIGKIEDVRGVENIDEIIAVADAIVICRSSLGMFMPPEKLFLIQKSIVAKCNQASKIVICGSHILKSMHRSRLPSRAEMLDVANIVLDGADGLLLSEEITYSPHFTEAINTLQNICKEAEGAIYQKDTMINLVTNLPFNSEPTYCCAISAVDSAYRCNASCIIVLTVTGRSAHLIARYRPQCPIFAVTRYGHVARKLNFWRAVIPLHYIAHPHPHWMTENETKVQYAITFGKIAGYIKAGDAIILVTGWKEFSGFTNTIRIIYVSQTDI